MNTSLPPLLFDRALARLHMTRASKKFENHRALFDDCAAQLIERLGDVKRNFDRALDLSPIPFLPHTSLVSSSTLAMDEEFLPFAPESFDLIVSNLALHWVNDVPGALTQIKDALKPDGLFLASLIGGQSLHELRACLLEAELRATGGVSPRLSPTIDLLSASSLMQRADFQLPVADRETITMVYEDLYALLHDLRGMGQTNAHIERLRSSTRRSVFEEAARLYQKRFGDAKGRIPATFDIIYLHGWK